MNLLTRRNSNKSIDQEARGSDLDKTVTVSADRGQDGEKPSLLRRLSRSISRTQQPPARKENDQAPAVHVEPHPHPRETFRPQETGDKTVEPVVDELSLKAAHHASRANPENRDVISSPPTVAHEQVSATTGSTTAVPVVHASQAASSTHPAHPAHPVHLHPSHSTTSTHHQPRHSSGLSKADIHHLFSGAPQFTLEKGQRGRYFPQAFFPWDTELEIADLQDRRYLRHESFALSTLHAHLPIPDEVNWKPGMAPPVKKEGVDASKQPMFELGIFERPNMLGMDGREPGTVGLRYFLERPVADGIQDDKVKEHGKDVDIDLPLPGMATFEAFKSLAIGKDNDDMNAKVGKHAPEQDRARLVHGGPHAWKTVGVRNISMNDLAARLEQICRWRDEMAKSGWKSTVLDSMQTEELHNHLFNEVLYPPRKLNSDAKHLKSGLKVQIEALVKVLTTPGAWLDLSVPEARLRFGKILHRRTTRHDHSTGTMWIDPERKWLLIQLLLAVELVIRLDAALRLGIALHSDDFELSSDEIHHFNKLRNLKVDWDLVAARRFLILCYVKKVEKRSPSLSPQVTQLSKVSSPERHGGFLGGLRHVLSLDEDKSETTLDDCDLAILPRQPRLMLDGLIRFAHNIGWPRWVEVQQRLEQKLSPDNPEEREKFLLDLMSCTDAEHITGPQPGQIIPPLGKFCVNLHPATSSTIGGWLSHTWLSGLILPGKSSCDLLMAMLLENDTDPSTLRDLGTRGLPLWSAGFILNGSSWWTKSSIVGRVMAPLRGSKEGMGWIHLPNCVPLSEATSEPVPNRWIKIKTWPVPTSRPRPRIFDGDKIASESSPLGYGKGNIMGAEFSMVTDHTLDNETVPEVKVSEIKLHLSTTNDTQSSPDHPLAAWAQFHLKIIDPRSPDRPISKQVRYGLDRAVYFVNAYPCRLPHGHATFKSATSDAGHEHHEHQHQHPHHRPAEHIPAHPLHKTYKFVTKTLMDLIDNHVDPPASGAAGQKEVWVVDARDALPAKAHGHDQAVPPSQSTSEHSPSPNPPAPLAASPSSPPASAELCTDACPGPSAELASPLQHSTSGYSGHSHSYSFNHHHSHGHGHGHGHSHESCDPDPQLWEKDILVRAWCAEKGRNAIIARVGRTCLSCAIREAKALEIGVIIRVGIKE
ncbi:hypothetical protein A1O3_03473 [Capronia epimyces CBS 606.96]|uniref:Uncharacterized protein n=1 Tax=Capronia epimyces CBS 606.96 TaxID=1182542 RepID=W9Y139_9EURO|nr:uncharacterized protein A1O3_03473 [Capronia epimyces CBS 606.96]EXJ86522.1 hypothetical protein A1O3_03473 [Capronia epimyces CBS 606.96]